MQSPFFAVKKFFLIFLIFFKNIKPSVKLNRLVSKEEEIEVLYQTKKTLKKQIIKLRRKLVWIPTQQKIIYKTQN